MPSNWPSRSTLPFATQLRATPPAMHKCRIPVSSRSDLVNRSTASSTTACTDAAKSMCRLRNGSAGARAGPPKSASKRAFVISRPVQ